MARLGGEFRSANPVRDRTRHEARALFLEKVRDLAPWAVDGLREQVLPLYQKAWQATAPPPRTVAPGSPLGASVQVQDDPPWVLWQFERGQWDTIEKGAPALQALRDELVSWAERWNMAEHWILDWALRMLRVWRLQVAEGSPPDRVVGPQFIDAAAAEPFAFDHRGWVPQWTPWEEYERALDAEYKRTKDAYRRELTDAVASQGLRRAPGKRARGGRPADTHFEWLVRSRVPDAGTRKAWSKKRIAREYGVKWTTVKGALDRIAPLLA